MIDISAFKGEIPKLSDKLLPDNYASSAINCNMETGALEPIKGVTSVQDVNASAISIYKMNADFLQWTSIINVVKALIADSGNRILYTGDSYPKETNATLAIDSTPYPDNTRRLGIPAPDNALNISLEGEAGDDILRTVSYVYTIVGKWTDGSAVESAPSPATAVFDHYEDITPKLTNFINATADGVFTNYFRIYRINTGNTGAAYQYVDEIATNASPLEYNDSKTDADLGEVLPTTDWTAPETSLFGLIATSHGLVFGFKGNTIYPSEIFITYAFPTDYSLVVESDIVGGGYTGSLVVILTETVPYLLIGQAPGTLSLKRLGYAQPCVAARSIVNIPGGIIYASPDGLFMINEAGAGTLITSEIFTRAQWSALTPANIIGFYYNEYYIGFFSGSTDGFSYSLNTKEYKSYTMPENIYGGIYSAEADELYLIQTKDATREIVSWETGSNQSYTWRSKEFLYTYRTIFTAGIIQGDFFNGNATFKLYVDGSLVITKTISDDSVFRLAPYPGTTFQIQLSGVPVIDRVIIGKSVDDVVKVQNNG